MKLDITVGGGGVKRLCSEGFEPRSKVCAQKDSNHGQKFMLRGIRTRVGCSHPAVSPLAGVQIADVMVCDRVHFHSTTYGTNRGLLLPTAFSRARY